MNFKEFLKESNYSDKIIRNAVTIYGEDTQPSSRGYILSNGYFLNFGNSEDHRYINRAFLPDEDEFPNLEEIDVPDNFPMEQTSGSYYMIAFMSFTHSVRYSFVDGNTFIGKLTNPQKRSITRLISSRNIEDIKIDQFDNRYQHLRSFEGSPHDEEILDLL